jgi:NAD(P)-dependent dehydrogenase (short-subunit alcohol dehydrogenase family)
MTDRSIAQSLCGKVAVITGGSAGIGQYTALGLARRGAALVIAGRNSARLARTAAWIGGEVEGATVATETVDFASLASVRALAGRLMERHARIDILVNNAGMITPSRVVTADGFESIFQVNHLAPYLLTRLLLPAIGAAAPSRIVVVASNAAMGARIDFGDLQLATGWRIMKAYGRSKLMNILFTYALARRLEGSEVTANCLHPGFVASRIGAKGGVYDLVWTLLKPFALTLPKGAETSIYAAGAPELVGRSGLYLVEKRPARSNPESYDIEVGERLWRLSAEMTGLPA